mmetsp:Transcript_27982/g.61393  ORF Transcript_27982/g.61393 Transcript_27982/m.61393 type:complete len:100 (-) Transcript_27982:921-1220(-)
MASEPTQYPGVKLTQPQPIMHIELDSGVRIIIGPSPHAASKTGQEHRCEQGEDVKREIVSCVLRQLEEDVAHELVDGRMRQTVQKHYDLTGDGVVELKS